MPLDAAFPQAPARPVVASVKKGAGKSKKAKWRRIETLPENALSQDVTATLVKRAKQQAPQLFALDATGGTSVSRSTQKHLARLGKGTASDHVHRAVEKTQKALHKRQRTLEQEQKARASQIEVFDVWSTTPAPRQKRPKRDDVARHVPNVKPAVPGQSVNPRAEDLETLVVSAAAAQIDRANKNAESERQMRPVTATLEDILGSDLVSSLTDIQKHKAFAYYLRLSRRADETEDLARQLEDYVQDLLASPAEDEKNDGAEAMTAAGDESAAESDLGVASSKKAPRKKTKSDRSRFERHKNMLREAAASKQLRAFNHAVDHIKKYIREVKQDEERQRAKAEYRKALAEAKRAAEAEGPVRFRCGKHVFEEPQPDVILPSAVAAAGGSLRKLKLSQVAGAAARDRMTSVFRRKLQEIPVALSATRHIRKIGRKVPKGRRFLVKF